MQQYSTDNSPVELELLSGHLLFADPLYFQDIADEYRRVDTSVTIEKMELIKIIEEVIFPYSAGKLLGYRYVEKSTNTYLFDPTELKKCDADDKLISLLAQQKRITTFGVDTASFLIIDLDNLEKIMSLINYDSLIDSLLANKLDNYFEMINEKLQNKGWAYVSSKGVNTESEFDGDGYYIIL